MAAKKSSLNLIKINSFVCIAFDAIKKRAKSCINQQYQIPFHCYCTILVFLNLICIHLSSDKWQAHTYDTTSTKSFLFFLRRWRWRRKWGEIQSNLNFLCSLSLSMIVLKVHFVVIEMLYVLASIILYIYNNFVTNFIANGNFVWDDKVVR